MISGLSKRNQVMSISGLKSKLAFSALLTRFEEVDDFGLITLEQGEEILSNFEVLSEGELGG